MSRRWPTRRAFLAGAAATAAGGTALGGSSLARYLGRPIGPETDKPPTRLLVIHKPCGTVPESYDCTGGETDFVLSPILEPFESLRSQLVVLDGLDIRKRENTPGQDHGNGMVTFMTGGVTIKAAGFRAVTAERASIDQLLANDDTIVGSAPIRSLQLAADTRAARDEVFLRVLSYAGEAAPVPPEDRPFTAFARVFGGLLTEGGGLSPAELERARIRKKSILDHSTDSLGRLATRLGSRERMRLDTHLGAIRETELLMDKALSCSSPDLASLREDVDVTFGDERHGEIGLAHLDIIRTAFQCDLSRVATFMWAPGSSSVNFATTIPGVQNLGHHTITHSGDNHEADEAAIHRWYNERMAEFITRMSNTPDLDGGSLLDNTLIVVFSEVRLGSPHTFDSVPIQLFGGAGGRLEGNRLLRLGGRATNDLWLAVARALGREMECFGDPEICAGPLPGVFS